MMRIILLACFLFFVGTQESSAQVMEEWVARYDGITNGSEAASALALDNSGNVYVTGFSMGIGTGGDYLTIKYDINGDTLWVRRYNGSGSGDDLATSLAIDDSGNVYITGRSDGDSDPLITNNDYATIKYSSTGDTLWVKRYNGLGNHDDRATALAVDGFGNVYITGYSWNGTDYDYVTIKYNNIGDTVWVRSYNGTGNRHDYGSALAVDDSGSVYVTGFSMGIGSGTDYLTIKYNSNGDILWVRRYDRPGGSWAYALTVDDSGYVYVTGGSEGDYVTIKYDNNGDTLWVRRYDGPGYGVDYARSLAVDDSGNVYITGRSMGSGTTDYDYATIKYSSLGNTLWARRYNGPADTTDEAYALDVDDSGNVYVTGVSAGDYATIKYNSIGDTVWVRRYNGPGNYSDESYSLAVDNSGKVYVTGESIGWKTGRDYATIKYNSNGDTVWVRRYNGLRSSPESAHALVLDGSGNVYVAGAGMGIGTGYRDYLTIKYTSTGDTLWVRRYDGTGNGWDEATALAVDPSGNVYVTGWSSGIGTYYDYATIKYSSLGDTLWVRRYAGPGYSWDEARALAIDDSANVYVTGGSEGDYLTIKYNSNGDTLWVRRYDRPWGSGAHALSVDDSGNVYVTGGIEGDYVTIKYNNIGDTLWVRSYNGPGNWLDDAYALSVDDSGNVYVTGGSRGIGTGYRDYLTIKYSSTGDTLWVRRYDGTGNGSDRAKALAVDPLGNVYVTGISDGIGIGSDYATIKYSSTGDTLWVRRYDGPGSSTDWAYDLVVDNAGNVYVTGRSVSSGVLSYDYATIKYSSTGDILWVMRYNGPGNKTDEAYDIAVDDFGNVYVTGKSYGSGTFDDFTTIKYSQTVGIEEENAKLIHLMRTKFKLFQNQPNPFSTTALIRYQIPMKNDKLKMKDHVQLVVYDITGRLVETLVDQVQEPGVYSIKWEAKEVSSGIYFYRLTSGSITVTKKMILLR